MIGQFHPTRRAAPKLASLALWAAVFSAILFIGRVSTAFAEDEQQQSAPADTHNKHKSGGSDEDGGHGGPYEPPLSVPDDVLPARPEKALVWGDWLFFPTVRTYTAWSDNLFQRAVNPISAWSIGIAPALSAEWTNGIHTSLIYGNLDARTYPSNSEFDVFDAQAGFIQKYSPLPDLNFAVQGDYTHRTIASAFVNAIPAGLWSPGTSIVLPDGTTILPDGRIIDPSGKVVGHAAPGVDVFWSNTLVNPSNQYTAQASVEKILNRGFFGVTGSVSHTEYENSNAAPDFTVATLKGRASTWLGPVFYAYTDGAFAYYGDKGAYRVVGGIGTRQFGLFQAAVYFGRQGSQVNGDGSAGGEVYGAVLNYYATRRWTVAANVDETVNVSNQTTSTNLGLNTPAPTALIVPIGRSVRVTSAALRNSFDVTEQWSIYGTSGYTHTEYLDSSRVDDAWLADLQLRYQIWRNLLLTWEYQYSDISSNVPLASSQRNYVSMSATYNY